MMISIILATMFLKQHSALDVMAGIVLGTLMDQIVYRMEFSFARNRGARRGRESTVI